MLPEQHLQRAIQIASDAHEGQMDRLGSPYFNHCRRVANRVVGDEERIVAYLHDVPEKASHWTIDRLREEGFSAAVVAAVEALTRRFDEGDEEFVRRAISNPLAKAVKQADLEDNVVQAEEAGQPTEKYIRGLQIVVGDEE